MVKLYLLIIKIEFSTKIAKRLVYQLCSFSWGVHCNSAQVSNSPVEPVNMNSYIVYIYIL